MAVAGREDVANLDYVLICLLVITVTKLSLSSMREGLISIGLFSHYQAIATVNW
jgi:hypothetical protein